MFEAGDYGFSRRIVELDIYPIITFHDSHCGMAGVSLSNVFRM